MITKIIYPAFAVSALLAFGTTASLAETKGKTITIKSEIMDVGCCLEGDDKGVGHKKCAVACAQAGNPIGLRTEKGDVYLLVGIQDHDANRGALIKKMADSVSVEFTPVKKGGSQVISVSAVQ